MPSPEQEEYLLLESALREGDLEGVRIALGASGSLANARDRYTNTNVLQLAIGLSDADFIAVLIANGADVSYESLDGFPALINALQPGTRDQLAVLQTLLHSGAGVGQRGLNDYTPLHYAATLDNAEAVALLLDLGADATARTRIDELSTALEEARRVGATRVIPLLEALQ